MSKKTNNIKISTKDKKETLNLVKAELDNVLLTLKKVNCNALLFEANEAEARLIESLDNKLYPLRDTTKRSSAYNIDKIVNFINLKEPAYSYSVVSVFKYQYVKDKDKCLSMIPVTTDISHNFERKELREEIEEHNYSQELIEKKEFELSEKHKKELELIEQIVKNPNDYNILISGYLHRVEYEQINYGVNRKISKKDKNGRVKEYEKIRLNKHLSVTKPNIIIKKDDIEDFKARADMEVKYISQRGFKIAARGVFYKKIAKLNGENNEQDKN